MMELKWEAFTVAPSAGHLIRPPHPPTSSCVLQSWNLLVIAVIVIGDVGGASQLETFNGDGEPSWGDGAATV